MIFKTQQKNTAGFTLVEILVSIAIFSVVVMISMGSVVTVLQTNRKAQALESVMNNLNIALDTMTTDLRFGTNYDCVVGGSIYNYVPNPPDCNVGGAEHVGFIDRDLSPKIYYLSNGVIKVKHFVGLYNTTEPTLPQSFSSSGSDDDLSLTASSVQITNLRFYVSGSTLSGGSQPKIIVVLQGKVEGVGGTGTSFNLQTTVSQRKPNF